MEYIFTFGSTSHSIKAEQTLLAAKLSVTVMPLPAAIRAGCGLCLRVAKDDMPAAQRALQEADVPIEQVYRRRPDGPGATYTPYLKEENDENT